MLFFAILFLVLSVASASANQIGVALFLFLGTLICAGVFIVQTQNKRKQA